MKSEREIAKLIFDKFRATNCKTNEIVMMRSIRFGVIDKLNPKEKEIFDVVFVGLQALGYFTYEQDSPECIRLTKKGFDYIYDDEQVELISQKPWVIPQHDTADWNKAFNAAWKVINEKYSLYYIEQSPLYNMIREINGSLPPFANYKEQRSKAGKQLTRELMFYDIINELPQEESFEFYVRLQDYIEKPNLEKEKPNGGIDLSFWETPAPTPAVPISNPIVEESQKSAPIIPVLVDDDTPTVFISYSWDTQEHEAWVLNLATKLMENGIDVILDKWDLGPLGKPLPHFMEQAISKSQRVICVMTPNYKKKTDKLEGGVGYEYSIITAEIFGNGVNTSKFIPLIREGIDAEAIPTALCGRNYINMRKNEEFDAKMEELLRDIHNAPKHKKPALGQRPKFD
ncbi:MAG: toll/interleukin-1 receptor domain-containing protein [Prevotellaceae bacterium]|jgi:hypothetical protein|nr:toll/interleukin-1 receptor domain-containing protein [Prevotellaceae bacterium]